MFSALFIIKPLLIWFIFVQIYVYDYSKEASLINPPRNIIPFELIEFELNTPETRLTKSLSSFNLVSLSSEKLKPIKSLNNIQSKITFEKTPAWRESYERSGLIELLTKYLKKTDQEVLVKQCVGLRQ